jgi:hypothetical protein
VPNGRRQEPAEPVVGVLRLGGTGNLAEVVVLNRLGRISAAALGSHRAVGLPLPPIVNVSAQQTVIDVSYAGELLVA